MSRRSLTGGLLVLGAALLGACADDRASVLTPLGVPSYDARLSADGRNVPNGQIVFKTRDTTAVTPTLDTTAAADTSARIRFAGLETLASGVYQVWLAKVAGDSVFTNLTKATGTIYVIRRDTTIDPTTGDPIGTDVTVSTTPGASTFTAGGPATRVEVVVNRASTGSSVRTAFNAVFLSIETATGVATPSEARPLWARFAATTLTRSMTFGRFHPRADSTYRFVATGRGLAGFRGPILIVDDSSLARPPIGYFYAVAVVKRDTATGLPVDTLLAGAQTAPYPRRNVSLRDADIAAVDPVVLLSPPSILAAASRVDAKTAGLTGTTPYAGFQDILVTLETKQGIDDVAPTIILSGTVSGCVRRPGSC